MQLTEQTENQLALTLFNKLMAILEKDNRTLYQLRKERKGFPVCARTMNYLKNGKLKMRPGKLAEICKSIGVGFKCEIKYFIENQ